MWDRDTGRGGRDDVPLSPGLNVPLDVLSGSGKTRCALEILYAIPAWNSMSASSVASALAMTENVGPMLRIFG